MITPSPEDRLKHLASKVSLAHTEKTAQRNAVLAFMHDTPRRISVPWYMLPTVRGVSAFLALLVITSTGGAYAAESSLPGDVLYPIKLQVTEPVRAALIFDTEQKTQFALKRTDRRLKEFAVIAASTDPSTETTELVTDALAESINDVSTSVDELAASGAGDEALATNADLQSVLSAHSRILDVLASQNVSASEDISAVSQSLDSGIADTENIEAVLDDTLASALTEPAAITEHAHEVQSAFEALHTEIQDRSSFTPKENETIRETLADIESILRDATDAASAEDAFTLYTEADERITELHTFIEADQALGIDILTSEE